MKTTVWPLTGLLLASRRVTVTVELVDPSAVTFELGEPEIVELAAETAPAVKVTVPVTEPSPAGEAMLSVLTSAFVDLIEPVATPLESVFAAG